MPMARVRVRADELLRVRAAEQHELGFELLSKGFAPRNAPGPRVLSHLLPALGPHKSTS